MITARPILSFLSFISPAQCTGPILGKELRVASRRRRHYLLRGLYLALLLLLMLLIWLRVMEAFDPNPVMTSRTSEAAKVIISSIAWFQFIALQIICVILLCNSISDEIYHRTLPTLISTPITSFQIVTGKLLSKLLQMLQLFAMSLPLLALVRVFGGVPWSYLVSTFCITLTTILYLSCLTLFFSIHFKRAYVVMIFTVIAAGIIFGLIPLVLVVIANISYRLDDILETVCNHICPYFAFVKETNSMFRPGMVTQNFSWPIHCSFMIAISIPIFILSCIKVRKAARAHITARTARKQYKRPKKKRKSDILHRPILLHSLIRRYIGSGMIWKEFLTPVLGRFRFVVYAALLIFALVMLLGLLLTLLLEQIGLLTLTLGASFVSFLALGVLFTVTVPATCITSEKESRCWAILLTTPMTETRILAGKIAGVLRRIVIAWSPFLFIFALIAYTAGFPVSAVIQLAILGSTAATFLIASGLYFSARLRRTTPAVFANLALIGILWALLPGLFGILDGIYYYTDLPFSDPIHSLRNFTWNFTPIGLTESIINHSGPNMNLYDDEYPRILQHWMGYLALYVPASILLLWRAKANLRRHLT